MSHTEFTFHDGLVIWESDAGQLDCLNPTASIIFSGLKQNLSLKEIASNLVSSFECDFSQAFSDTQTTSSVLKQRGLLADFKNKQVSSDSPEAEDAETEPCPHQDQSFPESLLIRVTDFPVCISTTDKKIIDTVTDFLDTRVAESGLATNAVHIVSNDQNNFSICIDNKAFASDVSDEAIVACLFQAVTHAALQRDNVLFTLHGGFVQIKNGSVLISGQSGSGKSTLIASLMAAGFACSHDDVVPIVVSDQPDGAGVSLHAVPVATPICLKQGSWNSIKNVDENFYTVSSKRFDAEQVLFLKSKRNMSCVNEAIDIPKTVVFPTYQSGAELEVTKLSEIGTLQRLIGSQLQASSRLDAETLENFLHSLRDVRGYSLRYGDLEAANAFIASL